MKKILFLVMVIFMLSLTPSNAQLEKGTILTALTSTTHLWGDYGSDLFIIGFSTNKYGDSDPYKCTSFGLIPRVGYFLMDNLAAGLDVALNFWTEKSSDSDDKESSMGFAVGPFVRYYYPLEKVYPFAEINFAIGSEKYGYESGSYESESSSSIMVFGFGVGAAIPLGEKVTFDTSLGYTNVTWKEKDEEADEKNTSGTIGLKMGFTILFGPK